MKTFTQLKKDIVVGKTLTLTYSRYGVTSEIIKKRIGVARKILKTQTNGITLEYEPGSERGSFLGLPCASLIEYDGKTIKIYMPGKRELTENEKTILKNQPSRQKENEKLCEIDIKTDGSQTYRMDKRYFNENNANWYWGWDKGLRYDYKENKMWDKKIKGELEMEFVLN